LCGVVLVILSALLFSRNDIDATVIRTPGMLFQERGADSISNLYNITMVNKTADPIQLKIVVENGAGNIQIIGKPYIAVAKEGQGEGTFFVVLPKKMIRDRKTEVQLGLYEGNKRITTIKTNFLGPVSEND
jgi:hypothetical protein